MDANDRAMAIDPSNPDTLMSRGLIHLTEQKFDDALALSEKSLLLAPNHAHIMAMGAIIARSCGKPQRAIDLVARAIRLCPIFPAWYLMPASGAYWAMDRMDESIAAARSAIEYDPDLVYGYIALARGLAVTGRDDEARRAAAELLRIDPGFSIAAHLDSFPNRDPTSRPREFAALRKAGLPE